jgi:hypothetical protein
LAGFKVIHKVFGMLPLGVASRWAPNVVGQSMADEEEFSTKLAVNIFNMVTKLGLQGEFLEDYNGQNIATEEGRNALFRSILEHFSLEGCFVPVIELVVEKV